jgi:DNA-3-methyladenine glycosylase I
LEQDSRCVWCEGDALYIQYHDKEWGVPQFDPLVLFEFLILEGAQAGLSWITILRKRENYRQALDGFDAGLIAQYDDKKINELLGNAGIVRNKLKISSTISNAQAFLTLEANEGFANYLWSFVGDKPIQNNWQQISDIPAQTHESEAMSKGLKSKGFRFVGPTICYAFMQAMGMVNDHEVGCFRHKECS